MLSKRVQAIVPSATLALSGIIDDMRRSGTEIISFSLGEPDFNTPQKIIEACKRALDEGYTKYTPTAGVMPLRQAISAKLARDNRVNYPAGCITVSTGAKQALNNAVLALVDPGDEVIVPTPCWVSYMEIIKLAGGTPVPAPCREEEKFQLDVAGIARAITPRTKAILLNTPNNPTGAVYERARLQELARLAVEHNLFVITDEVYEKLVYQGEHICIAALGEDIYQRTVVVNGLSKACCMTGWRMGYTAAPPAIAQAISSLQGHTTSNSTSFVQYASIEALTNCDEEIEAMRREFSLRREFMLNRLREMPDIACPDADGAFYLLPNISRYFGKSYGGYHIADSNDFCAYLLAQAHIGLVPGAAFAAPQSVRISYSNSLDNLARGLDQMQAALALLR